MSATNAFPHDLYIPRSFELAKVGFFGGARSVSGTKVTGCVTRSPESGK